jgi:hypothetical protein
MSGRPSSAVKDRIPVLTEQASPAKGDFLQGPADDADANTFDDKLVLA